LSIPSVTPEDAQRVDPDPADESQPADRSAIRAWLSRKPRWLRFGSELVVVGAVVGILILTLTSGSPSAIRSGEHSGVMQDWSISVTSGEAAVFSGELINTSGHQVKLLHASLITDPGKPVPRLVGVEISTIFAFDSGSGWPLKDSPGRPFPGQLKPGKTTITYGTSGRQNGTNYVDLGLRIEYADGNHTRTMSMWAPGVTCVRTVARISSHQQSSGCSHEGDAALAAANRAAS
jgi:hypothetical protein